MRPRLAITARSSSGCVILDVIFDGFTIQVIHFAGDGCVERFLHNRDTQANIFAHESLFTTAVAQLQPLCKPCESDKFKMESSKT
jgi:hypothetical protein